MLLNILPSDFLLDRSTRLPDLDFPASLEGYAADVEAELGFGAFDPFKKLEEEIEREFALPDPFAVDAPFDFDSNPFESDPFFGDDVLLDGGYDAMAGGSGEDDPNGEGSEKTRKPRAPNLFEYEFGDVYEANWYRQYLQPSIRQRTYDLSERDRFGEFSCGFRMPLAKVDELVSTFLDRGWIHLTHHCQDADRLYVKAQLLILGALEVLAHHTPFRKLRRDTEICAAEHQKFFHLFLDKLYSIKSDYISYPRNLTDLKRIMSRYNQVHLPGCGGSIDVVHLKWSNCPAGDRNRCVGKEGYPTLAFEVVSGFDREILGVSSVQYGTRNDQHIVNLRT